TQKHFSGVLHISGAADANITLHYTTINSTQNYFLQGGTILRIVMTATEAQALGENPSIIETIHNRSLHISSDTDIVVQMEDIGDYDGALIYPSDNQAYGNEYILNGSLLHPFTTAIGEEGGFTIVSRCNNTLIEITPS